MFGRSHVVEPIEAQLAQLEVAARAVAEGLDPDAVPACDAAALYARLDHVARVVTAARTLLARRVADARAWQSTGHQNAAELLASVSGSSIGAARSELETSAAIRGLPEVQAGMRSGALSPSQGAVIADAGKANPTAARDLVDRAGRSNLHELREQAGRVKAAADPDPKARRDRIHKERRCSRSTRSDGTWTLTAQGTVEDGAVIAAMLDRLVDELYRANRDGEHLGRDTLAFDALVLAARRSSEPAPSGDGAKPKRDNPRFLALIRADVEALRRGALEGDELCEIAGVGPIPVDSARRLLSDAILKLVITKGVDVANVVHLGRGPNAAQKVALWWSSPGCIVEGCSRTHTEFDHREDFARTRHTTLSELEPMCDPHHDRKTHEGWALVPGKGKRPLVPPDDPRHPKHQPRPPDPPPVDEAARVRARKDIARRAAARLQADLDGGGNAGPGP